MSEKHVIKLRGLPWNVSVKEIMDFLKDINVENGEKGVHLAISSRDGRPNGEAFVECASEEDFNKSFDYNKNILGHRYIEIFSAKLDEFEYVLKRQNVVQHDTFVKLRGLPYTCKPEDIEKFFEGLEIRNEKEGIHIVVDNRGRSTGEAFVQFTSPDDTEKALKKNRDKIGHRYIEIFRSSSSECRRTTIFSRPSLFDRGNDRGNSRGSSGRNSRNFRDRPYDSPWGGMDGWRSRNNFGNGNNDSMFGGNNFGGDNFGRKWGDSGNGLSNFVNGNFNDFNRDTFGGMGNFGNGNGNGSGNGNMSFNNSSGSGGSNGNNYNPGNTFLVHMRGMPYDCGEKEIVEFFEPLNVVHCEVLYNNNGRHTGEADAYFTTFDDAQDAMKKHKEKMGARYIELFFNKNRDEDRRGGNGGRRF